MGATFKHNGDVIDYTPSADVDAGDVVVQGELVGVAKLDIAANVLGSLAVKGVFDFPKASGDGGVTAGAECYWDATNKVATDDSASGANKLIGKCILAAADTDITVRIRMSQ